MTAEEEIDAVVTDIALLTDAPHRLESDIKKRLHQWRLALWRQWAADITDEEIDKMIKGGGL